MVSAADDAVAVVVVEKKDDVVATCKGRSVHRLSPSRPPTPNEAIARVDLILVTLARRAVKKMVAGEILRPIAVV